MWSQNGFSHLFGNFYFLAQLDHFGKTIAFASEPNYAIFKMLSYKVFFGALTTLMWSYNRFSHVSGIFNF